ncbi:unnamed protein product [Candida verbasci]|uniref:Iron permease FTR1 n=1 Tax=Candida verbasci TaxID=1227364 RepID=A0A9W4XEJ4_9ASCO|nr:unnamed protein product [Candida verbasci]
MIAFENYFSIQVFFIILRETLETAIIISVLLSFINQRSHTKQTTNAVDNNLDKVQKSLKFQVWFGAILGLLICFIIGLLFILVFYFIGKDYWSYTERLWEGIFSILSSLIITIMGIGLLRINKVMKLKWWIKLGDAYDDQAINEEGEEEIAKLADEEDQPENYGGTRSSSESESIPLTSTNNRIKHKVKKHKSGFSKKYFLAILPLITTLREGLEAVVFIGGIGMSQPLTSIPLSIICGISFGSIIGYILYKGGNKLSLQYFLIFSNCVLYIVSAGLISRGVWFLELESFVRKCGGLDISETGSGPGSYDISNTIWHVNCCNGLTDGWWMVLNAMVGWTNTATYGSVIAYILYWTFVIIWLRLKLYEEKHGILPIIPITWQLKRIRKIVRLYELRCNQDRTPEQNELEAEAQGLLNT